MRAHFRVARAESLSATRRLLTVLSETAEGCTKSDRCLTDSDLDVVQLSLNDSGAHQISWVDSFVIAKDCPAQCVKDAVAFIQL